MRIRARSLFYPLECPMRRITPTDRLGESQLYQVAETLWDGTVPATLCRQKRNVLNRRVAV